MPTMDEILRPNYMGGIPPGLASGSGTGSGSGNRTGIFNIDIENPDRTISGSGPDRI